LVFLGARKPAINYSRKLVHAYAWYIKKPKRHKLLQLG
jgi:hypothetical protein